MSCLSVRLSSESLVRSAYLPDMLPSKTYPRVVTVVQLQATGPFWSFLSRRTPEWAYAIRQGQHGKQ